MYKVRTYITLAAVIALASCSSNDAPEVVDTPDVPISLSCSLAMQTRAYATTQATQIAHGRTISVWCDEHVDKTDATNHATDIADYVKAWQLTVDNSTTSGTLTSANTYIYPKTGNNVDFFALHGNFNNAVTEGTTTWATFTSSLTHTVRTNQTGVAATAPEDYADGYEQSDLLYAVKHNIAKTKTTQLLQFKHLMSKIEINLICGSGMTAANLTSATVQILNTKLVANLSLSKSDITLSTVTAAGTIDGTTKNAIGTKMQTGDETVTVPDPANPGSNTTAHAYAFAEAIIVPQKFDTNYDGTGTGLELIQVTLSDSSKRKTKPATYVFEPGKRYVFNLTVNAQDLELSTQITDWDKDTLNPIDIPAL